MDKVKNRPCLAKFSFTLTRCLRWAIWLWQCQKPSHELLSSSSRWDSQLEKKIKSYKQISVNLVSTFISVEHWANLLFLSVAFCNLKKRESYWLTPRRISLHSVLSIQEALRLETIKLVSIWGISERGKVKEKQPKIPRLFLLCGPLLTSNHRDCQSPRRALYFNDWVSL